MEGDEQGNPRRSLSESGRRRSSSSSGPATPTSPTSPGLMSELNLDRSISNPDLVYLRENIIESPIGHGLGTRLQARKSDKKAEKLERTLQRVEYLRLDVESWAWLEQQGNEGQRVSLEVSIKNYDQLMVRKKALAKEALLRGADMKIIRQIEGLGTRMDNLRKLAERRALRKPSSTTGTSAQPLAPTTDEVFDEDQVTEGVTIPPPSTSFTQIEPEREKTPPPHQVVEQPQDDLQVPASPAETGTGEIHSPSMTASVERIIRSFNAARSAAEQGEEVNTRDEVVDQIIASIRSAGATIGVDPSESSHREEIKQVIQVAKDNSDKLETHTSQLSALEAKFSSIQASIKKISDSVSQAEAAVSKLKETQINTQGRVSQLEQKVYLIDSNIKTYIGRKLAPIKERVSNLRGDRFQDHNTELTPTIQTKIRSTVEQYCSEVGLTEIRQELRELRDHNTIEERTVENLREIVVEVREQVSRNPLSANITRSAHTSTPVPPDPTQSSRECEVIRYNIERSIRQIRQLTATVVNMGSDVGLIKKCNKEDTSKVNKYVKTCGDDLVKYIKYPDADQEFCREVQSILDAADDWVMNVENIYARSEAHAISDARGDISRLIMFNNNAEKTVFEFIDEADMAMLGWGTSKQRASLLSQHLSEEIKSRTAEFSDNFSKLREWLIKTYGRADRIIGDISAGLKAQQKPSNNIPTTAADKGERYTYFANICTALARFDKLAKIPDIKIDELNAVMYCRNTVAGLIDLLPGIDQDQLRRKMTEKSLDWDNPQGCATYSMFKEYCEMERNIVSAFRGMESKLKPKPKAVFISRTEKEGGSDDEGITGVHSAAYTPPAPWYPPGMRFPCPLVNHNHEMAECKEWLSMSPADRWENTKVRRICYACLKPKAVCNERKCKFYKNVNELITCQGCVEYASSQGWAPFSILMCRKRKHAEVRAKYSDIKKTLDKYLGQMPAEINESNLKVSANFAWQVHATAQSNTMYSTGSLDTDKPLNIQVPCIDTNSGTRVYPDQELIQLENDQHAHYLMQTLQIGQSQVLTFFDSGANSHLISGEVAEAENLEKYSSQPTRITVVGGGSVCSEYGSYKFGLGPDEENKFHELRCIGIENVTSEFRKYDLLDIIEEYKGSVSKEEGNLPLPKYAGGGRVSLLIGIKNTNLVPVLIKTLKSGVGVYKSPFKDIFGSRIIFAGPHAAFTRGNRGLQDEVSHAVFHINRRREERLTGTSIPYSIIADKQTGACIYPTPLSRTDYTQLGAIPEENTEIIPSQAELTGLEAHVCRVRGDQVPIARMRELINQDDPTGLITFRCSSCSACIQCRRSPRTTAISLQESREQEVIEKSVTINLDEAKVHVKLPFMCDPVPVLKAKHGGNNNYRQAISVYKAQCRKPERLKEGMRKVHEDLVEKGFMMKLSEMSKEIQELIEHADFNHYYPWNIVENEGSISTPLRMVVDPSMTGLNQTLAKGENKMGNIFVILVRCLSQRYAWASDISKLYNQLRLEPSALPFSLFLYHASLDSSKDPEKWVMVRAWYGVTPTGSQAGFALDSLARASEEQHPEGSECILNNRYVDDIPSGAGSVRERETQINQVQQILKRGGFSLKYVVRSGEDPDPKATTDGTSTKMLGYKWEPREDVLRLGFSELNLNKRVRGAKKPNEFPVSTQEDAEVLLQPIQLSRRQVVSKIAELFDPVGLWEPIKLNLKLMATELNGFEWDSPLPEEMQEVWKNKLREFVDYKLLSAQRGGIPTDEESDSKIRLIVMADAAEHAGGAAVYAGRRVKNGEWTCKLVAAKSKLMKYTIPRNELSAILLATELAFLVKKALGDKIQDIIYVTDSTIALSWCHNTSKKLRAFIFARVESIRRMIQWTIDQDIIPLFHIEGTSNIADLLTKKHNLKIEQVSIGSPWQEGEPWMKLDFKNMPLVSYDMLSLDKKSQDAIQIECFSEPFLPESKQIEVNFTSDNPSIFRAAAGEGWGEFIIDPVKFGWQKTIRILNIVLRFSSVLKHRTKHKYSVQECELCYPVKRPDPRNNHQESKDVMYRFETKRLKESLSKRQLEKFKYHQGILYYESRISKENPFKFKDLDKVPFIDVHTIKPYLPVVQKDSPVLYSLIIYIHCQSTPHIGVERTVKEVFKEMFVIGGLRELIKKIKSQCITCRKLERSTVELKMDVHPAARTTIAPPFYCSMVDIAFGFAGKAYNKSRARVKIYALVFCCLLTGATNILALEGIETGDIVQAIERHASRHGVPGELYIDNGSQLKTLEGVTFKIRDVDTRVYDSHGIKVYVSNAKAHEERGRIERKIRSLRETLERLGVKASNPLTALQWESVFARIASTLDDMPLAKGSTSTASNLGYEIITANRLKLGRNNSRSLEGAGLHLDRTPHLGRMMERNREIYHTWYTLFIENIHELMVKPDKWDRSGAQPREEDIVMFVFNDSGYSKESTTWKLGRVVKIQPRKVIIEYVSKVSIQGKSTLAQISRNPRDVSILFSADQLFINTNDHFSSLFNHE